MGKTRIQYDANDVELTRMKKLMTAHNIPTRSELLRKAVKLMDICSDEGSTEVIILRTNEHGEEERIIILI